MSNPPEPCRTCDGQGFVETAAQNSRVIHYEPCQECGGPFSVRAPATLVAALVQEYAEVLARRGQWGLTAGMNTTVARALEDGARSALLHVAERLGVTDLHERAAKVVARGEEQEER